MTSETSPLDGAGSDNQRENISIKPAKRTLSMCVADAEYRGQLVQILEEKYAIIEAEDGRVNGETVDAYLLDINLFHENKQHLLELKEIHKPEIFPVLIFTHKDSSLEDYPELWDIADDILALPVAPDFLMSRVSLLIRYRKLSGSLMRNHCLLKKQKEELQKEKDKLRLITENSTDMITLFDPEGRYTYVSPSVKQVLGYSPEDILDSEVYAFIHPEDREETRHKHKMLIKNRRQINHTYRQKNKRGEYRWLESISKPIINPDSGNVDEFLSSTRDVSRRFSLEKQLIQEKEFLYYAADNMPGVFYVLNEDLEFVYWNKNFTLNLEYSDREVQGLSLFELFEKKDHGLIRRKIETVFNEGRGEVTVDVITKSGEKKQYHITGSRIKKGGKQVIIGFGLDVTDKLKAQYESHQQRLLMDAIINQSTSMIFVKSREGEIKLVNKRYADFHGLDVNQVVGRNESEFLDEELLSQIKESDEQLLKSKEPMVFEEHMTHEDEVRYFETVKYELRDVPGFEHCICGISQEVTDRKRLIFELGERNKEKNCLLNITEQIQEKEKVEEILQLAVSAIPAGFKHPEYTFSKITYGEKEYRSKPYKETEVKLRSEIVIIANQELQVSVCVDTGALGVNEASFLKEEQDLLNSIAKALLLRIGELIGLQKLHESEKRWEDLVQNDPDLIMIVKNGIIEFINNAGARMYQSTPGKMKGKKLFEVVEVEDQKLARERIERVLRGERVNPYIHRIKHPVTKDTRYVQIQSLPVRHEGEPAVQIVGTDMTERINFENNLRKTLHEKEVLLQEVHHRVKNNLAVVSGLLQLKMMTTKSEELNEILLASVSRIKSMALVHEKLYQQDSVSHIDFKEYVNDLLARIKETWNPTVQIKVNCQSLMLNINQAVPCALMLNEICTNAMKHAFDAGKEGAIEVSLHKNDERVFVEVRDNGVGFSNDFLEDNSSMGVTILKTLRDQLGANLVADNENGARVRFDFECREMRGSAGNIIP